MHRAHTDRKPAHGAAGAPPHAEPADHRKTYQEDHKIRKETIR